MKAKPYYNGSFPRVRDKHNPPEVVEEFKNVSKRVKGVTMYWYIKQRSFTTKRIKNLNYRNYLYIHVWDGFSMKVVTNKRKFKNRKAALNALGAIANSRNYFKETLVNYKIYELI